MGKRNRFLLYMAVTIVALAMGVTVKTHVRKNDSFFATNLEALSQTETVLCIYDPEFECIVMDPENPELDDTRPYSRWWH